MSHIEPLIVQGSDMRKDRIAFLIVELEQLRSAHDGALDELSLEIVKRREDGATVRALAQEYGTAPSSIQSWTTRGRAMLDRGVSPRRRRGHVSHLSPVVVLSPWLQWALTLAIVVSFIHAVVELALDLG